MKWYCFLPLLGLATPSVAQNSEPRGQTIIVTGTLPAQTERALRDCIARHCPPNEDIAATLAHAENQFVAGDYKDARRTLRASMDRNRGSAAQFPIENSYLYRAGSRVSAHLGEGKEYEQYSWGIKRALKAGLPDTDPRLIAADLEVAGMQSSLGRPDQSRSTYAGVIADANRLNRPDLAAMARLRLAWLSELEGDRPLARRGLREVAADRSPATRAARLSALVLLARLDRLEGRKDSSDALIEELRSAGMSKPALLFAPEIDLPERVIVNDPQAEMSDHLTGVIPGETLRLMATENFEDRWVDIGFWITTEGRVDDLDILRHNGPTYWAKPLLKSIAGRIYSPSGDPGGTYRVERYSYTSLWMDRLGTRLRQRAPNARLEYLDLTAQPEPQAN
jgi:hypothetical protein